MKKLNDRQIRWIVFIGFLLIPYFLSYIGTAFNFELIGRLAGLTIFSIGFPILFLWLLADPKYKDSFGASIGGKRYTAPGRILGLLVAIIFLFFCRYFVLDLLDVAKKGAPMKEGYVLEARHTPYTFLVRDQSIVFEGQSKDKFSSIFSPYLIRTGDFVSIRYLPRTKWIIEISKK